MIWRGPLQGWDRKYVVIENQVSDDVCMKLYSSEYYCDCFEPNWRQFMADMALCDFLCYFA
jgi:hypothetical protein